MAGIVVWDWLGDYSAGFSFGKLGMDLVDKAGLVRFKAEAYMTFGHAILPSARHIREGLDLTRRALTLSLEAGNLNYASYTYFYVISEELMAGLPLAELQKEAEHALEFVRKAKFGLAVDVMTAQRHSSGRCGD